MLLPTSARHARVRTYVLCGLLGSELAACGEGGETRPSNAPNDSTSLDAGSEGANVDDTAKDDERAASSRDAGSNLDAGRRANGGSAPRPASADSAPGGQPTDGGLKTQDASTRAPRAHDGSAAGPVGSGSPVTSTSFAESTLIPHSSWTCGMPEGIPSPVGAPLVFTADFEIRNIREVGHTQFGKRQLIELGSGTVDGARLKATLQKGGLDQPLVLSNGAVELEEILTLRTSDNRNIYLRVCGTAPNDTEPTRIVMDFEAPTSGPYGFLNDAKLVGTRAVDLNQKKIKLSVHDVGGVAPGNQIIAIGNPVGATDQTWDCREGSGAAGKEIYKEVVNIGSSLSVGASKRGNRNIIPITGGTTTGRIKGLVLPGGGDFQLLDAGFLLDARYTLLTDDEELILVRNCGPASALIPIFEARSEGPYGYLNANDWLSSSPSLGLGTVTLTITEKRAP